MRVLQKPEVRHLTTIGCAEPHTHSYHRAVTAIIQNLKKYLTVVMTTKGTRKTVEQRCYRTVLAACSGSNLVQQKLMGTASQVLVSGNCFG